MNIYVISQSVNGKFFDTPIGETSVFTVREIDLIPRCDWLPEIQSVKVRSFALT